jgi:hypothetical protein
MNHFCPFALRITGSITGITKSLSHSLTAFQVLVASDLFFHLGSEGLQAAVVVDTIFATQMLRMHEVIHYDIS